MIARELHRRRGQQLVAFGWQAERFALSEAVESSQVTGWWRPSAAAGTGGEAHFPWHDAGKPWPRWMPALRDMLGHAFRKA